MKGISLSIVSQLVTSRAKGRPSFFQLQTSSFSSVFLEAILETLLEATYHLLPSSTCSEVHTLSLVPRVKKAPCFLVQCVQGPRGESLTLPFVELLFIHSHIIIWDMRGWQRKARKGEEPGCSVPSRRSWSHVLANCFKQGPLTQPRSFNPWTKNFLFFLNLRGQALFEPLRCIQ